jgi:RNA recognition motif-containing protein
MMAAYFWVQLPPAPCVRLAGLFLNHLKGEKSVMETKLYVGNLAYETTEDDLRTLFAQAGSVESVDLIKDRASGRSKGFAFVVMANQSELEKAIQMFNNYTLGQRQLTVNIARPREERAPAGNRSNWQGGRKQNNRGGSRRY